MSDEDRTVIDTEIAKKDAKALGVVGRSRLKHEGSTLIKVTPAHVRKYLQLRNEGMEPVRAAQACTLAAEGEPQLSISPRQARMIEASAAARQAVLSSTAAPEPVEPEAIR